MEGEPAVEDEDEDEEDEAKSAEEMAALVVVARAPQNRQLRAHAAPRHSIYWHLRLMQRQLAHHLNEMASQRIVALAHHREDKTG